MLQRHIDRAREVQTQIGDNEARISNNELSIAEAFDHETLIIGAALYEAEGRWTRVEDRLPPADYLIAFQTVDARGVDRFHAGTYRHGLFASSDLAYSSSVTQWYLLPLLEDNGYV